eukprot:136587_1
MSVYVLWSSAMLFHAYHASFDSIKSSLKIPTGIDSSAVGYDDQNDIILMFGGYEFPQLFIQFKNNTFMHHNESYLPPNEPIQGFGSNYFQLNNTLWVLNQQGTHFITINTHPPYNIIIPNITIPILVDNNGCFSMTQNHIFVVGGATTKDCDAHEFVQIYDIKHDEWLTGVPSLTEKRMNHACYVTNDTLYAIGGVTGGNNCEKVLDSILALNVSDIALSNISSQQWQLIPGATLNQASWAFSVVQHNTDLILIGGADKDGKALKDVHLFNTVTGDCDVVGTLATATSGSVSIIHTMSNTLFTFGGFSNFDEWQYINLPTENPTTDPTKVPTQTPTVIPSFAPTADPTIEPTAQPSFDPTALPTYVPTVHPTRTPTVMPTFKPTMMPTVVPTTRNPTMNVVVHVPPSTVPTITETELYTTTITGGMTSDIDDSARKGVMMMDNLAMILIVVCGSLCFIILITLAVGGYVLKRKNKERKSRNNDVLENTVNTSTVVRDPNDTIGEKDESVENEVHVSVRNSALTKETEGNDDVELAEVVDESSSNESLFDDGDDHVTRGALAPESMQNAINFMIAS